MALAMPKSMTFGMGTPSWGGDEDVGWLDVAMDDPFWWACWMAWQTSIKRQPLDGGESVLVAVVGDPGFHGRVP